MAAANNFTCRVNDPKLVFIRVYGCPSVVSQFQLPDLGLPNISPFARRVNERVVFVYILLLFRVFWVFRGFICRF